MSKKNKQSRLTTRSNDMHQVMLVFKDSNPLIALTFREHPVRTMEMVLDWYAEHSGFDRRTLTGVWLNTLDAPQR